MGFLLAFVLVFAMVQPAQAATKPSKKTINNAQQKDRELKDKKDKAEQEQRSLKEQLNSIIADMQKAQADVEAKEAEIEVAEDELTEAKMEEDIQYESMKIRIKYMYENGDANILSVLFSSDSMSDFLNKAEYVEQISSYDRQMLVKFQDVVKEVAEKEATLKADKEKLVTLQNTLGTKKQEVNTLLASKNAQIADLQAEIGANAKELQRLIAAAEEADRLQNEAANSGSGGNSGSSGNQKPLPPQNSGNGVLMNPCPGGHVTSEFGPRKAPVAGASTYHNGMDYGAPEGTPVYAAASGTVITVSYTGARGNYIIIRHDNGLQTLYQHLSSTCVREKQKVGRGDNIGKVGHTGISSGPHLHFEVHKNGTPVNPRNYY